MKAIKKAKLRLQRDRKRASEQAKDLAEREARSKQLKLYKSKMPERGTYVMPDYTKTIREGALSVSKLPSLDSYKSATGIKQDIVYEDPELQARENEARKISNKRKNMIAPVCNKGVYVYIGDAPPEVLATIGRKV